MDFAESTEHRALRAAVAEIAQDFGPRYYAERAAARRPCAELWKALGEAGFIGVNIPEAYGGPEGPVFGGFSEVHADPPAGCYSSFTSDLNAWMLAR